MQTKLQVEHWAGAVLPACLLPGEVLDYWSKSFCVLLETTLPRQTMYSQFLEHHWLGRTEKFLRLLVVVFVEICECMPSITGFFLCRVCTEPTTGCVQTQSTGFGLWTRVVSLWKPWEWIHNIHTLWLFEGWCMVTWCLKWAHEHEINGWYLLQLQKDNVVCTKLRRYQTVLPRAANFHTGMKHQCGLIQKPVALTIAVNVSLNSLCTVWC